MTKWNWSRGRGSLFGGRSSCRHAGSDSSDPLRFHSRFPIFDSSRVCRYFLRAIGIGCQLSYKEKRLTHPLTRNSSSVSERPKVWEAGSPQSWLVGSDIHDATRTKAAKVFKLETSNVCSMYRAPHSPLDRLSNFYVEDSNANGSRVFQSAPRHPQMSTKDLSDEAGC